MKSPLDEIMHGAQNETTGKYVRGARRAALMCG
jgi:hypothetical protein